MSAKRVGAIVSWILALVVVSMPLLAEESKESDAAKAEKKEGAAVEDVQPVGNTSAESETSAAAEAVEADANTAETSALAEEPALGVQEEAKLPSLPCRVHCGEIVSADIVEESVRWKDLDQVLAARKFRPDAEEKDETWTERSPAEETAYAVIAVEVKPGRSLGKHDYVLRSGAQAYRCLALSVLPEVGYDARVLESTARDTLLDVRMLFEVPAGLTEAELEFGLPVTVPVPAVPVRLASLASSELSGFGSLPASAPEAGAESGMAPSEEKGAAEPEPAAAAAEAGKETPAVTPKQEEEETAVEASPPAAPAAAKPAATPKKPEKKKGGVGADWF